jgi:indoleamine 2,3-dioxygenase
MFPDGVVYEGVSTEPTFYRGESGANDSIIPSIDNFLQLTQRMPENPMTEILRDFRTYRPVGHREWLEWLENSSRMIAVRDYALKHAKSSVLYLALLDQIREFRGRHWNFTKKYILEYTVTSVGMTLLSHGHVA